MSKLILIYKQFKINKLEEGDCIIDFSAKKLLMHRNEINEKISEKTGEEKTNHAAIVYGRLPP